jgi:hypothetical protein
MTLAKVYMQAAYASLLKSCIPQLLKLFFHMQYCLGYVSKDHFYLSTNKNKLYSAFN